MQHATLEAVIDTVAARGLWINNLFNMSPSKWRANVTDGNRCWEFGDGDTPAAALEAALGKVPLGLMGPVEADIFA